MTPEFQAKVEAVIGVLEKTFDRQYPLRSIPMDMVAEAVAKDCLPTAFGELSAKQIADSLNRILVRNMAVPHNAWSFRVDSSSLDVVSPWEPSSFAPHEGSMRLREGG